MDGNGRWAQARGLDRSEGHIAGVASLRETVTTSVRLGIDVLSAYAFSTENWKRPQHEVDMAGLSIQGVDVMVDSSQLGGVTEGSYAEAAGLEAGDVITSVNGTSISTWDDLVAAIGTYLDSGTDFDLTYVRDGMDIDAAGLPFLRGQQPPAGYKDAGQLREISDQCHDAGVPFVLKGVMSPKNKRATAKTPPPVIFGGE